MGDVSSPVLVVEKARFFVNRVSEGLAGLPAPLAFAKLYNALFVLAMHVAATRPEALDEILGIIDGNNDYYNDLAEDPVMF